MHNYKYKRSQTHIHVYVNLAFLGSETASFQPCGWTHQPTSSNRLCQSRGGGQSSLNLPIKKNKNEGSKNLSKCFIMGWKCKLEFVRVCSGPGNGWGRGGHCPWGSGLTCSPCPSSQDVHEEPRLCSAGPGGRWHHGELYCQVRGEEGALPGGPPGLSRYSRTPAWRPSPGPSGWC